jgi:cytochrome c553
MLNIIVLAIILAAALFFVWLCSRLRRVARAFLRWPGMATSGLVALILVLICGAAGAGLYKEGSRSAPIPDLRVELTDDEVQRGQDIAAGFCGSCHSRIGTMTGGEDLGKHLPINLGSFISSNLTNAGALKNWSDGEIFRAIRNGVDAEGHRLVIMSLTNAGRLSDDDIHALIAYIRRLPADGVATPDPPDQLSLLGLVMLGVGQFPPAKPVNTGVITGPLKAPTFQYGEYLLSYQDCRECHGKDLTGGVQGQWAPIGPGLGLVEGWSRDEFMATLRTGKDPGGHEINERMPWRALGKMDDVELSAIYEYLTHMSDSRTTKTD